MGLNCYVHIWSRAEKPGEVDQNPNQAWPNLEMKNTSSEIVMWVQNLFLLLIGCVT